MQLMKYRLPQDHLDNIISMVLDDKIHLVFDGVDEMARPYTASGRCEAIEILSDIGNRCRRHILYRSRIPPGI